MLNLYGDNLLINSSCHSLIDGSLYQIDDNGYATLFLSLSVMLPTFVLPALINGMWSSIAFQHKLYTPLLLSLIIVSILQVLSLIPQIGYTLSLSPCLCVGVYLPTDSLQILSFSITSIISESFIATLFVTINKSLSLAVKASQIMLIFAYLGVLSTSIGLIIVVYFLASNQANNGYQAAGLISCGSSFYSILLMLFAASKVKGHKIKLVIYDFAKYKMLEAAEGVFTFLTGNNESFGGMVPNLLLVLCSSNSSLLTYQLCSKIFQSFSLYQLSQLPENCESMMDNLNTDVKVNNNVTPSTASKMDNSKRIVVTAASTSASEK